MGKLLSPKDFYLPARPKGEVVFYFFTWFSFYELGGRYTLIFSIEVTSSGDAGDRYTLIDL